MTGAYRYSLFGLIIQSNIHLPELFSVEPGAVPDVIVRMGTAADVSSIEGELYPIDGGVLLKVDSIARYAIFGGAEIIVQPEPGVSERNVRLYLLGSAMGMLLHQRGLLPLHANAVEIEGKAFAFMGQSGAGKSTLAAWFHDHQYRIIADDVCVVRFDPRGRPLTSPGLPRLRLWKKALEATGRQPSLYSRSYVGDESYDKYDVPIAPETAVAGETELAAIYLLGKCDRLSITPLLGVDAAEAVFANIYRGSYISQTENIRTHWETCLKLIRETPIFLCNREWDLRNFSEQALTIVSHAKGLDFDQPPPEPIPTNRSTSSRK